MAQEIKVHVQAHFSGADCVGVIEGNRRSRFHDDVIEFFIHLSLLRKLREGDVIKALVIIFIIEEKNFSDCVQCSGCVKKVHVR